MIWAISSNIVNQAVACFLRLTIMPLLQLYGRFSQFGYETYSIAELTAQLTAFDEKHYKLPRTALSTWWFVYTSECEHRDACQVHRPFDSTFSRSILVGQPVFCSVRFISPQYKTTKLINSAHQRLCVVFSRLRFITDLQIGDFNSSVKLLESVCKSDSYTLTQKGANCGLNSLLVFYWNWSNFDA